MSINYVGLLMYDFPMKTEKKEKNIQLLEKR